MGSSHRAARRENFHSGREPEAQLDAHPVHRLSGVKIGAGAQRLDVLSPHRRAAGRWCRLRCGKAALFGGTAFPLRRQTGRRRRAPAGGWCRTSGIPCATRKSLGRADACQKARHIASPPPGAAFLETPNCRHTGQSRCLARQLLQQARAAQPCGGTAPRSAAGRSWPSFTGRKRFLAQTTSLASVSNTAREVA